MKKQCLLLAVLLLLTLLASCAPRTEHPGKETDTGLVSDTDTAPVDAPCEYSYTIAEEMTIVNETELGGKCTKMLRYPVIDGMEDGELQAGINETLRNIAENKYVMFVPDIDIYLIENTIFNYEVASVEVTFLSDTFLSVKNRINLMTSNANYPDESVYTVNLSLITGEVLTGDDIYGDFTSVASRFLAGDFTQVYGRDGVMQETSPEDMILQYNSEYARYPETCFTEDSLVLNIDLVPALGSAAGYAIPLEQVRDFLLFTPTK